MLVLKSVSKTYQSGKIDVKALKGVSIEFENTGMYFLLGKSGSGKSTLLNLIGGLDKVTSGEIVLDNEIITSFDNNKLNSYRNYCIGFVFQEFNLISNLNVKENIAIALRMQGEKVSDEAIIKILEKVELVDCINRKVNELSGGQKQRVAIARALIKNPKIILADEPTGALDSETSTQIFTLLKKLSKEHLVIVVSHDEEFANEFADEIIRIKDGLVNNIEKKNEIRKTDVSYNEIKEKSSIPFISSLKIGFSNLRINIVRLFILIFLSVVAFTSFGLAFSAMQYNKGELMASSIVANGYVDPFIIVAKGKNYEASPFMNSSFIDNFNNTFDMNCVGVYNLIGPSNKNYALDINELNSGEERDVMSLRSLQGLSIFNKDTIEKWGYSIYGNYPTNADEILIPEYFYETFKKYGYSYKDDILVKEEVTKDSIIGKKIELKVSVTSDRIVEYKIVGILDTKLDTSLYSELNSYSDKKEYLNPIKQLFSCYRNGSIHSIGFVTKEGLNQVYLSDQELYDSIVSPMPTSKTKIKKVVNFLTENSTKDLEYKLYNTTDDWIMNVNTFLISIKALGSIAGGILLLFSGLLLFNYINLSISYKKKEIGILRALGASGSDTFKIFGIEGVLITFINIMLSLIVTGISVHMINKDLMTEYSINANAYTFNFLTIILIILVSLLSCFLSIFLPIFKFSRKTPMQVITE